MNPFAETYALVLDSLVPVFVAMLGSLILGTMIGLACATTPERVMAALRADHERTRRKLIETEDKLALSGSILTQRLKIRDEEAAAARRPLEQEVSTLNAQVHSLKMALVAAKRPVPTEGASERARIAELEKEAARIPALEKELELLRQQPKRKKPAPLAKNGVKPQPLPEQVFRVMSGTFGRRIEQDDLKLVEGIGPKIAEQLNKHGLKTWADVATAKPAQLKKVLAEAGDRFQMHDPSSWPEQCRMMVEHRWDELRKYQRKLSSAR